MNDKENGYLHTRSNKWGKLPEALMHDKTVTDGAKVLYTHMHWRYGNNCKNFEGQQSMADFMDVARQTISDRIDELVQHDWVVVVEKRSKYGRRPNFYHVFEVQCDCQAWREDHGIPKPPPKVDKDGHTTARKPRAQIGGKPSHNEKPTETQVNISQCKPELTASYNQLHDNQSHSFNSFEANASHELASAPSEQETKANLPHLNTDERKAMKHLLQAVQNGRVVESAYNPKIVRYLLELGEIERCDIGLYPGLCLKEKAAPDHPTRADNQGDPAVDQFNAELAREFAPISGNGNGQSHMNNQPDSAHKTPDVPEGYEAVYDDVQHLVKLGGKNALCGIWVHLGKDMLGLGLHKYPGQHIGAIERCPKCEAKLTPPPTPAAPALPSFKVGDFVFARDKGLLSEAVIVDIDGDWAGLRSGRYETDYTKARIDTLTLRSNASPSQGEIRILHDLRESKRLSAKAEKIKSARAAAPKAGRKAKAKPAKPAIYSSAPLFDAIALFSFKASDKADVNAVAGRVAKIRVALADYVIAKLGHEPTPEETEKVVNRVKELPDWYDRTCKKCDRPQSADTFMTWYVRYVQSMNGTAQGNGDGCYFDNGWFKRENGVLYKQNERNSEVWEAVK